jgi:hypothetical protein
MENAPDPYEEWLGIPRAEQPVDYYRLLGVERFETNRTAIREAADARLAFLKNHKVGPQARLAQKVASQVSKACSCLLNPTRKALYDNHLRSGGADGAGGGALWPPVDAAPADSHAKQTLDADEPEVRRWWNRRIVVAAGATALITLVVALYLGTRGQSPPRGNPAQANSVQSSSVQGKSAQSNSTAVAKPIAPTVQSSVPRPSGVASVPLATPKTPITAKSPDSAKPATPEKAKSGGAAGSQVADGVGTVGTKPDAFVAAGQNALRFDGNSMLEIENSRAILDVTQPFTVELWVRFQSDDSAWLVGDLVVGGIRPEVPNGALAGWQLWVMQGTAGRRRLAVATRSGFFGEFAGDENVWHHLAIARDAEQVSLYVDGRRAASEPANLLFSEFTPSPIALHVGGHPNLRPEQPRGLRGDVRGVRISNVCRYSDNFVPSASVAADASTLVALRFDARSAGRIEDASGHSHDGVLRGAEWFTDDAPLTVRAGSDMFGSGTAPKAAIATKPSAAVKLPADAIPRAEKRKVPSAAELDAAERSMRTRLAEDLAKAKRAADHREIADKLLRMASDGKDDSALLYVIYREARQQAVLADDYDKALKICDESAEAFDVDVWEQKVEAAHEASEAAKNGSQRKAIAQLTQTLAEQLVLAGRYDLASDVISVGVTAAARSREAELGKSLRQQRDQIWQTKRRAVEAQVWVERLKSDPDNGEMNQRYGSFLCFDRGDWDTGIPHLAKGTNATLRRAAEKDEAASRAEAEQGAAFDGWCDAVEVVDRDHRDAVRKRALYWASLAAAHTSGLARSQLESRMAELERKLSDGTRDPFASSPTKREAGESAAAAWSPPEGFQGLLGRVQVEGNDIGVLWKYSAGLQLTNTALTQLLQQAAVPRGRLRIEFVGFVTVTSKTEIQVQHSAGVPDGKVQAALTVDGRLLGEVGGSRANRESYKLELSAGEHRVQWVIAGVDLGVCALQFRDGAAGNNLPLYHTPALLNAVRDMPFRARINVNMIQN